MIKTTLLALTIIMAPLYGFGLSVWVPTNFGQYIDFLNDTSSPYKIVYGHFSSVDERHIEDRTAQMSDDFIANGYTSKWITAAAVFELVDPRRNTQRDGPKKSGQLNVTLTASWSSEPDFLYDYMPEPDDYLEISFEHYANAERGNQIMIFSVEPNGALTYTGYDYTFDGPFTRDRAQELAGCVFDNACTNSDLRHLRGLHY